VKLLETGFILDVERVSDNRTVCMVPALLKLASGKILVSFRRGTGKDSADGNGMIMESWDGKSWNKIFEGFENTANHVQGEIRCIALLERPDGVLVAFLSWFDRSRGERLYDSSSDTLLPSEIIAVESRDGGKTWADYRIIDTGNLRGTALCGQVVRVPHRGWLIFFEKYCPEEVGGRNLHAAHAIFTPDGKDFTRIVQVARHPENRFFYWDQRNELCMKTGRIVSMFWTYNRDEEKDEPIHIAWGDTEKLKWTQPVSTGIKGQIAEPIPLPDGRLLMFYVHRHAPGSMRLVCSDDGGKRWDIKNEIVVYDSTAGIERGTAKKSQYGEYWNDMQTWSFGHPASLVIDNHTVLLAFYGGKSNTSLSARWALIGV